MEQLSASPTWLPAANGRLRGGPPLKSSSCCLGPTHFCGSCRDTCQTLVTATATTCPSALGQCGRRSGFGFTQWNVGDWNMVLSRTPVFFSRAMQHGSLNFTIWSFHLRNFISKWPPNQVGAFEIPFLEFPGEIRHALNQRGSKQEPSCSLLKHLDMDDSHHDLLLTAIPMSE